MNTDRERETVWISRRRFLHRSAAGLGVLSVGALMAEPWALAASALPALGTGKTPHLGTKAKSVIVLSMAGGPSQLDLFDPKPTLNQWDGRPMPETWIKDERFTFIEGSPRILGSPFRFRNCGESGVELSELLPHLAGVADEIALVRSMHTSVRHHAPAQLSWNTGAIEPGAPSLGAWATWALRSRPQGIPGYAVLLSGGGQPAGGEACWGSGNLPDETRGSVVNAEFARRELAQEPEKVRAMYGAESQTASFANNCLLARRLVQRGAGFVQIHHRGWDTHGTSERDDLVHALSNDCRQIDRPAAALIKDLKQRGLLDSTLVVWAGEFGRTPMRQRAGSLFLGRDHHPHAFSIWMAGGGIRPGVALGRTDEFGYRVVEDAVSVPDLQATILHCLGLDHRRLAGSSQDKGLRPAFADAKVVTKLLT